MKYELISIEKIGEYKIFKLFPMESKIEFIPGQFIKLSFPDGNGKPYSIASPPGWPFLEFLIHITHGPFTSLLDKVEKGQVFDISKAAGHFTYNEQKDVIFIAGGAGIAPIISMLRYINAKGIKGNFNVFYSTRTFDNSPYLSELLSYSSAGLIKLCHTLTREQRNNYMCGRFNADMIKSYCNKDTTIYLCGNREMAKEFMPLKELVKEMKIEAWG
jgi:ferredoxin-NADP reductase